MVPHLRDDWGFLHQTTTRSSIQDLSWVSQAHQYPVSLTRTHCCHPPRRSDGPPVVKVPHQRSQRLYPRLKYWLQLRLRTCSCHPRSVLEDVHALHVEDVHELHMEPLNSLLHLLKLAMDKHCSAQPRLAEKACRKVLLSLFYQIAYCF